MNHFGRGKGLCWLVVLGFQPTVTWPCCLWALVKQHIMARVCGRESCTYHGGLEARETERSRVSISPLRTCTPPPHFLLEAPPPSNLSPASQVGGQAFDTWLWEDIRRHLPGYSVFLFVEPGSLDWKKMTTHPL